MASNGQHLVNGDHSGDGDDNMSVDLNHGVVNEANGVNDVHLSEGIGANQAEYEGEIDLTTDNHVNGNHMDATVNLSVDNSDHADNTYDLDDAIADETYDGDVEDSVATSTQADTDDDDAMEVTEMVHFQGGEIAGVEVFDDEEDNSDTLRDALDENREDTEDSANLERCIFCLVEDPTEGIIFVELGLPCEHKACRECFNKAAETSMASKYTYPFSCPCCKYKEMEVDFETLKEFLDPANKTRLVHCQKEYGVRNPTWCFIPTCSAMLHDDEEPWRVQFLACAHCNEHTCTKCKALKTAHPGPGVCPDLLSAEDRALMEEKGWKQCPNTWCRKVIERSSGSLMMACLCGTRFCWKCLARIDASWVSYHCGCRDDDPIPEPEASKTYLHDPRRLW